MLWNGKMKALTFSYDDGLEPDERLADIFDRYGMKCTFNLNGSHFYTKDQIPPPYQKKSSIRDAIVPCAYMPIEKFAAVYKNHEVAGHSYHHPYLAKLPREEVEQEIAMDIEAHTRLFGKPQVGMAYPMGSFDEMTADVIARAGLRYSRTTKSTGNFDLPENPFMWHPTCHHSNWRLMELAETFANLQPDKPQLFYVWGHSYEFAADDNWERIERFCEYLANRDDIFYGTNAEVLP